MEEHYLDWFFLSKFGVKSDFWRELTEDKLIALITLQNEYEYQKEKRYWENWQKIIKAIFKG